MRLFPSVVAAKVRAKDAGLDDKGMPSAPAGDQGRLAWTV